MAKEGGFQMHFMCNMWPGVKGQIKTEALGVAKAN